MIVEEKNVTTEEVRSWSGLNLLHFKGSGNSMKVQILLKEKGVDYISRPVDVPADEHMGSWFLGINPRGVVPVLVHDGVVHVESRDIMEYIDALPTSAPSFRPQSEEGKDRLNELSALEQARLKDMRTLTFGFMVPPFASKKRPGALERYESEGAPNSLRMVEVNWWRDFAAHGVSDEKATACVNAYRSALSRLQEILEESAWLLGDRLSIADLMWFPHVNRLNAIGYPLSQHPRVHEWWSTLLRRPSFREESSMPFPKSAIVSMYLAIRRMKGTDLSSIAGG